MDASLCTCLLIAYLHMMDVSDVEGRHVGDVRKIMKGMENEYSDQSRESVDHLLSVQYLLSCTAGTWSERS